MKLRINRVELLNSLNKVSRAVNSKTPLLALTGIKFTLTENYLELIGSDSDLSIRCIIEKEKNNKQIIEIEEIGSIVINEKIICEIIRKVESEMVEISVIDNLAKIKSDKSIFSVNCIPAIDYPTVTFNDIANGQTFTIDALELKSLFDQTLFATSDKESRPVLTGLNFKCEGNTLEVVATDTYRLTKKIVRLQDSLEFNVTIPKNALDDVNKIVEVGQVVKVNVSDKKVSFDLGDCNINTRVISGTYPDTSRLIPHEFTQILNISTKELVGAVDRASILLTEKNNVVKLNMDNEEVFVSSKSMEVGYVVEKLNEYSYQGEKLTISFSAKFLLDAIRALASEEISLHFTGDMKPIIIKSKTNPDLIQLILPVRTYN
mgnify:CR=1 FL=1